MDGFVYLLSHRKSAQNCLEGFTMCDGPFTLFFNVSLFFHVTYGSVVSIQSGSILGSKEHLFAGFVSGPLKFHGP